MNRYSASTSLGVPALLVMVGLAVQPIALAEVAPSPRIELRLLDHQTYSSQSESKKGSQTTDGAQSTQTTQSQNIIPVTVSSSINNTLAIEVEPGGDPAKDSFFSLSAASFVVEDVDTGVLGVPVCFSYEIQLAVEATQSGVSVAAAGVGGASDDVNAEASLSPLQTSVRASSGGLFVSDLGFVESYSPLLTEATQPTASLSRTGVFLTATGETIEFSLGVAVAVAVQEGEGFASGSHSVLVQVEPLSACPPPPPPVPVPVGQPLTWFVLAMLMGLVAGRRLFGRLRRG